MDYPFKCLENRILFYANTIIIPVFVCVCFRVQLSGKEKEKVKKEALDLCMKYSFVTPFTSMVVTKPQGED